MKASSYLVLALSAVVCFGQLAATTDAQSAADGSSHIDSQISGYWEMRPDSLNAPPAELTRAAMARKAEIYKKEQYARRWCDAFGMPAIMESYRPVDIVVGPQQVVVPSEFVPLPRHIYLRDKHNDPEVLEPSVNGDSIGHFEGDDLVVETILFSETGLLTLPGGGFRTKNAKLAERFHPMNDGKNLLVTSTWYDPTVFVRPYTYSVNYYRIETAANHPYWAGEAVCDPQAPNREMLLQEPKPVNLTTGRPAPAHPGKAK